MSKHIFWIASYPKSGNTLLRSILSSLFFTIDGNFKFDHLKKIVSFEELSRLKKVSELKADILKKNNVKDNNNLIYNYLYKLQNKTNLGFKEDFAFFKTHFSAQNENGQRFIIDENIRGIIYIVRDPRDVCISWSKHADLSIDESINFMINENSIIKWTDIEKDPNYPLNTPVYLFMYIRYFLLFRFS